MRRARSDSNEKNIVDAFRKMGATVERIRSLRAGCPDLLVGYRSVNQLIEVKVPKTGRLSDGQKAWRDGWQGRKSYVVKTVDEVISLVKLWGG